MTPGEREAVKEYIDAAVSKAVSEIDLSALRGKDGRGIEAATVGEGMLVLRYTDGTEQIVGRVMGEPGSPGADAVLDKDALVREVVSLIPTPKDGKDAEPVDQVALAKDILALIPVPRDGKDGIASLDDLRAEVEKSKTELASELPALAKAALAEVRAEDPWPVYREIWREGEYEKGAVVTWAGSAWIAREATDEKPGAGATKWKLFVKQGRDGKAAL